MRTKCYSVRLKSLVSISDRACKATSFDGSTEIIPLSQILGIDYDVQKSDAYWISAWILERKDIQYSDKKVAWFDELGNMLPTYTVEHYTPKLKKAVLSNEINELKK